LILLYINVLNYFCIAVFVARDLIKKYEKEKSKIDNVKIRK